MDHRLRIIADDNIPFLRGRLEPYADVTYVGQDEFTPGLVRDADALMIRTRTRCDAALLGGSGVRLVATATIGTDQIDMEWCRANGIDVANSPGCNAPGVAQYVWSALLRCGFDPRTMTLGVVGYGNIGGIVARWGEILGARVLVCDPPRQEAGCMDTEYHDMGYVLANSDAVTLHTPLTRGGAHPTYHLIGAAELSQMRPGSLLVNAARGAVVDNAALRKVLEEGGLRAVLDTWEGEPRLDRDLLGLVEYGTQHIAGYSREGKERATRMVLEALNARFGLVDDVSVLTAGLTGPYCEPENLTAEAIVASYDPGVDTAALRAEPDALDRLRGAYDYRHEVGV